MSSLKERYEAAVADDDLETLKTIFTENADFNTLMAQTQTTPTDILASAVLADDLDLVRRALSHGAQVDSNVEDNAHLSSSIEIYRLLIPHGLDVNRDQSWIGTPLIAALEDHNEPLIKFLLENGANPNHGMSGSRSPFDVALIEKSPMSTIKLLVQHGVQYQRKGPFLYACLYCDDGEIVEWFLTHGADVNEQSDDSYVGKFRGRKMSALHLAALNGHGDVVKVLLEHGADKEFRNADGQTALEVARAAGGKEDVVELLK